MRVCGEKDPHIRPPATLLQELCEGGDWFDRLLNGGSYSERHAAEAARALLETVSYCHSLGVVHRCEHERGYDMVYYISMSGGRGRVHFQ